MRHGCTWGLTVSSNFLRWTTAQSIRDVAFIVNHTPVHYLWPPLRLFKTCSIHTNITLNISHSLIKVFLFLESQVIILNKNFFYWTSFSLLFLTIPGNTSILDLADYLTLSPLEIAYKKIHKKNQYYFP